MTTTDALNHWTNLAQRKQDFAQAVGHLDPSLSREAAQESLQARGVAESLRLKIQTGIPHCSCTAKPHALTK